MAASLGVLEWELIAFPAPFKGDAWVTSMEILPSEALVMATLLVLKSSNTGSS